MLTLPESPEETAEEQNPTDGKQQKIRPRKIPRDRELDEKNVREETCQHEKKSNPERPVPISLHNHLFCSGALPAPKLLFSNFRKIDNCH
jgi:hypothetical protein